MYWETVDWATSNPSISSSPWIRGAPHSGFSLLIRRMRSRSSRSTFGRWFSESYPMIKPAEVERFWLTRGWQRTPLDMGWRFERREDLEAVVRIEFKPADAERYLASHTGVEVDYAINLWSKTY